MRKLWPYEVSREQGDDFARALVQWYDPSRRPFPWRQTKDVYVVATCELLLQRTNAEKVARVASQLLSQFPTPEAISVATIEAIGQLLQPLGLPIRAKWIHSLACRLVAVRAEGRQVQYADLVGLPGMGAYILSAIGVLAFDRCDAVIDDHVLRVLRRVFSVNAPADRHPTRDLRAFADGLVPPDAPRDYNLALLDLGRLICRPRNPNCGDCPLTGKCDYAWDAYRAQYDAELGFVDLIDVVV